MLKGTHSQWWRTIVTNAILSIICRIKRKWCAHLLDTSAGCANDTKAFQRHFEELQKHTDLILLDIKHIDNDKHIRLTGKPNTHILNFARKLSDMKQPVWIRHVLVPGYSDDKDDLIKLGNLLILLITSKSLKFCHIIS